LVGELFGLLLEKQLECAFGESGGRRGGDLFHGAEVDAESRSVVTEGLLGDDFGPLFGEGSQLLDLFGRESVRVHGQSCQDVAANVLEYILLEHNPHRNTPANRDVTSRNDVIQPSAQMDDHASTNGLIVTTGSAYCPFGVEATYRVHSLKISRGNEGGVISVSIG
jgi:hypothetical protein